MPKSKERCMPRIPKKPCAYSNCPELTYGTYCDKHKKQVNREYNSYQRDDDSKKFYSSTAWRKLSKLQLKSKPLCEECLSKDKVTLAKIADHIQPIKEGGARLDTNNLQSLCLKCHNTKHK